MEVVCETENGSSLTFAGAQSSNMSDGGARNNNKEVFSVFVNQHPLKPNSNPLEPHQILRLAVLCPLSVKASYTFLIAMVCWQVMLL